MVWWRTDVQVYLSVHFLTCYGVIEGKIKVYFLHVVEANHVGVAICLWISIYTTVASKIPPRFHYTLGYFNFKFMNDFFYSLLAVFHTCELLVACLLFKVSEMIRVQSDTAINMCLITTAAHKSHSRMKYSQINPTGKNKSEIGQSAFIAHCWRQTAIVYLRLSLHVNRICPSPKRHVNSVLFGRSGWYRVVTCNYGQKLTLAWYDFSFQ